MIARLVIRVLTSIAALTVIVALAPGRVSASQIPAATRTASHAPSLGNASAASTAGHCTIANA